MSKKQTVVLANQAKEFRISRGWSQKQMAEFCRVSRATIARLEARMSVSERIVGLLKKTLQPA